MTSRMTSRQKRLQFHFSQSGIESLHSVRLTSHCFTLEDLDVFCLCFVGFVFCFFFVWFVCFVCFLTFIEVSLV